MALNLLFRGELGDNQSWGISSIGNIQGFLACDQNVTVVPNNVYGNVPDDVQKCITTRYPHYDCIIRQGLASHMAELEHQPRPMRRISLCCWDSDLIPEESAEIHNRCIDGVIALSRFTKQAFLDAGVKIPIHIGGQGVDTNTFRPRETPKETEVFTFIFVSVAQGRKGTQELLDTFAKLFKGNNKVRLVVKSNSWGNLKDFNYHGCDNIEPIYEEYTREGLADLYRDSDCFVLPTQGDSFLLPGLEASACGLPLIITDFGGPRDYCNHHTGYPIDYDLVDCGYLPGHQAKPSLKHLEHLMDFVVKNQDDAKEKGEIGALVAQQRWTWQHDAERTASFLEGVPINDGT